MLMKYDCRTARTTNQRWRNYAISSMVLPPQQKPRSKRMSNPKLENGALITRDAHVALSELKTLVDRATEKLRTAERETIGVAIGHSHNEDPLRMLQDAAETLHSPSFGS